MSDRWFFDDDNCAYLRQYDGSKCYSVFNFESPFIIAAVNKLPITNIEIIRHDIDRLSVKFKNQVDEAYFRVLTAEGIEI